MRENVVPRERAFLRTANITCNPLPQIVHTLRPPNPCAHLARQREEQHVLERLKWWHLEAPHPSLIVEILGREEMICWT